MTNSDRDGRAFEYPSRSQREPLWRPDAHSAATYEVPRLKAERVFRLLLGQTST